MSLKIRSRRTAAFFSAVLCIAIIPAYVFCAEFEVYGGIQHFTWKEYDSGAKLLEESGPVFVAGGITGRTLTKSLSARLKGEIFGGGVDYDGQTQSGHPVTTDTDYLGAKLEADLIWNMTVTEKHTLAPFAGVGARIWNRDIQSTLFRDQNDGETKLARGYTEKWRNYYGRAGISGTRSFDGQWQGFFLAGARIPVYTENVVNSVVLEPGNRFSGFAEAGLEHGRFKISLFYEGLRFSKSDRVYFYDGSNYGYMYQPESKADIFGISAGVKF